MRWPLQPSQPLQQTQIQPPFGQSVDSLCHPWFTTTNLSYSAAALCGTTGSIYISTFLLLWGIAFVQGTIAILGTPFILINWAFCIPDCHELVSVMVEWPKLAVFFRRFFWACPKSSQSHLGVSDTMRDTYKIAVLESGHRPREVFFPTFFSLFPMFSLLVFPWPKNWLQNRRWLCMASAMLGGSWDPKVRDIRHIQLRQSNMDIPPTTWMFSRENPL